MEKLRIDLPILLPSIDEGDGCVALLTDRLAVVKGVEQAHVVGENGTAQLCIHFDPNLISLPQIERLAQDAGAAVTDQYRHEQAAFTGLDAADAAFTLEQALAALPGMLHARVNYAAGLIFVAYDSRQLDWATIERTVRGQGARLVSPARGPAETALTPSTTVPVQTRGQAEAGHDHTGHEHPGVPGFLPHWMQERWSLLLVCVAGAALLIGWSGATFFGWPEGVALVFYLIAYVAGGYEVATHAIPGLLHGKFDTDVLMLAAATGAAILGEWAEGAFLLFLFSLAHVGEHYALDRARNAVSALGALMPRSAQVKRGERLVETPVEQVEIGDVVLVRPGDRIPVDGQVARGVGTVDQSPITGESVPVNKGPGDEVFAGTVNQNASLEVTTTRLAADNTLSRVLQMVQEAQSQQSPSQQFAASFTRRFVPAVLVLVAAVILLPPLLGWMPLSESFYRGMLLLVAASPCALAIGTPAAVLAGIAQAARNGVLIKGGVHLENLGTLRVMAFDKTGTLTEGRFQVTDVVPLNGASEAEVLQVAGAVEQQSNHPLAVAVVAAAQARGLELPPSEGLENIAGRGVRSQVNGQPVLIGSLAWFQETAGESLDPRLVETITQLEAAGRSTLAVAVNGRILGVVGLADQPRPGVQATLTKLLELGVRKLVMLTGDNAQVAQRIGREVGVTDVRAGLLPGDKLTAIQALEREYGAIAMTGDGVNDAPALAMATVGIAMGGAGTAVALETADVALMADDLGRLPFAVGLSRASRRIIVQNLAIALGVIAVLIFTSVLGWVQLSGAVILHEGSTIVVVLNALRLLTYRLA